MEANPCPNLEDLPAMRPWFRNGSVDELEFFFRGIYYDRRMGLLQGLRGCYGGFAIEPKGRLPTRRGRGDSIV
jgi:hypothetical protein